MALRNYSDASIEMQHMPAAITTITKELLFNILILLSKIWFIGHSHLGNINPSGGTESLPARMSLLSPPTKNVKANFYCTSCYAQTREITIKKRQARGWGLKPLPGPLTRIRNLPWRFGINFLPLAAICTMLGTVAASAENLMEANLCPPKA